MDHQSELLYGYVHRMNFWFEDIVINSSYGLVPSGIL